MKEEGYTMNDYYYDNSPKCPICSKPMVAAEFGTTESDESVPGLMCEEEGCGHTIEFNAK